VIVAVAPPLDDPLNVTVEPLLGGVMTIGGVVVIDVCPPPMMALSRSVTVSAMPP
jgi:hypothetical protein